MGNTARGLTHSIGRTKRARAKDGEGPNKKRANEGDIQRAEQALHTALGIVHVFHHQIDLRKLD